jgi:hypothetical protein
MAVTKAKAEKILKDKEVHGQPLSPKQRRFFGSVAGGQLKAIKSKIK